MKIAFVVYGSLDLVSGGFIYDRLLVEALRRRGATVEVVALPWRRGLPGALAANVAPWPAPLARGDFDLVVQDELVHPSVVLRNRRLRARRLPVVALVHNLGAVTGAARLVEQRYLREVDGVIAVCDTTRRDVERLRGEPMAAAAVAYPGGDHLAIPARAVDDAFIERRARGDGPLRLLMVAAVLPHKGLHRLLAALTGPGAPPRASWTLDVAGDVTGDPAYVRAMRAQIGTARLGDRVRLHGLVRGSDLWAHHRRCHLLVLPSDREAYPLACLEALAFGLPPLVTSQGGTHEMIDDAREGWLLPPDDPASWAAAIAHLATDRAHLATAARAARARFTHHPSWDGAAANVEGLLATLRP